MAVNDFVAAAGAADAEGQDEEGQDAQAQVAQPQTPPQPRGPDFERPQDLQITQDGWINYQENDFTVMYDIHRQQLENYNAENDAEADDDNNGAMQHDNAQDNDGNNGVPGHNGFNNNDNPGRSARNEGDGESDMARQRRIQRHEAMSAAAPVAPRNQNTLNRGGPNMTGLSQHQHQANRAHQPALSQHGLVQWPGEAPVDPLNNNPGFGGPVQQNQSRGNNRQVESHGSGFTPARENGPRQQFQLPVRPATPQPGSTHRGMLGPLQKAPRHQQAPPRAPTMQPPTEVFRVIHGPPGLRGQLQSPGFNQHPGPRHQHETPSGQRPLPMGFVTPARPHQAQPPHFSNPAQGVPAGYGTVVRPGQHYTGSGHGHATPIQHRPHPARMHPATPRGQIQRTHLTGPVSFRRPAMPLASERARLPRENQQAASAPRPVHSSQIMGFPPPVARNAPPQQLFTPQPVQQQPANAQSASSAGPGP